MVTSFKYLGVGVFTATDNDWLTGVGNPRKARTIWARMAGILGREGARPWVLGMFFQSSDAEGTTIWVGYVGDNPLHVKSPGVFP